MIVNLPAAKWHKHVVRIDPGATSGYDWHGPEDGPNFLPASPELPAGAIVISFDLKSAAYKGKAALFTVIDGPILHRVQLTPADETWTTSLAPYARPLLEMSDEARALWTAHMLLTKAETVGGAPIGCETGSSNSRYRSELTNLRRLYAGRLSDVNCNAAYAESSLRLWLAHQSDVCGLSPLALFDLLREHCDLTRVVSVAARQQVKTGFRVSIRGDS